MENLLEVKLRQLQERLEDFQNQEQDRIALQTKHNGELSAMDNLTYISTANFLQ